MKIFMLLKLLCIALGGCLVLIFAAAFILVEFALVPSSPFGRLYAKMSKFEAKVETPAEIVRAENWNRIEKDIDTWYNSVPKKELSLTSFDGLTLRATEYRSPVPTSKWVIIIHGYSMNRIWSRRYAVYYSRMGYNVVTPDNRARGDSDGNVLGMGWLDRLDILRWINVITTENPDAQIVLHGISMGGATVMMIMGEQLPPNVIAGVEDCGYTSVKDEFAMKLQKLLHLPRFPFLAVSSLTAKLRCGYFFGEASSVKQLEKNTRPMLFIHGEKDDFVPTEMVYKNYESTKGDRKLLVVKDADHAHAMTQDPDLYWQTISEFLDQYVK